MKKQYKDLHGSLPKVHKAFAIEILEGKGEEESPAHRDYFVFTESGEILGRICPFQKEVCK